MFQNLFKSLRTHSLAWWLVGLSVLVLVGMALFIFAADPAGNRRAAQASSDSADKANASGRSPGNVTDGLSLDAWNKRIASASPGDLAALMREVLGIKDSALRTKVATALVAKWVSVDLAGFIAFVDETEVDDDGEQADSLWALLAPALANALPTLSDEVASSPELNEIVRRLIEYSARQDPVRALAWAKQWLLDDTLESALATIAGELVKKSPEQALQVLGEIHASVRRVDAISAIAPIYGTSHPKEATDWAKTLAIPAERPYAVNAVLAARAEVDPAAAAVEFVDFRDKLQAAYAVERAANVAKLGISDIKEQRNGEPLTPEEAMDSENLPGRDDPQIGLLDDAAKAIAENWAASDPSGAMQWSESLPAGALRNDVVQSALAGWASEQPEAAYAYYMKNHASQAEPAEPIFEAWAQAEPAHAAEQAAQLVDPALREKAISGVVSGWLDSSADQTALDAWVDKLPSANDRDLANSEISEAASYDQPNTAWKRATEITDPRTRRDILKSAFASLVESDPAQARALLAEAKNLTPNETTRLNKMLNAVTSKSSN